MLYHTLLQKAKDRAVERRGYGQGDLQRGLVFQVLDHGPDHEPDHRARGAVDGFYEARAWVRVGGCEAGVHVAESGLWV